MIPSRIFMLQTNIYIKTCFKWENCHSRKDIKRNLFFGMLEIKKQNKNKRKVVYVSGHSVGVLHRTSVQTLFHFPVTVQNCQIYSSKLVIILQNGCCSVSKIYNWYMVENIYCLFHAALITSTLLSNLSKCIFPDISIYKTI